MVKKIIKSGNSGAITLDRALLELIHAKIGDEVSVHVRNGSLIITPMNVGFTDDEIDEAAGEVFSRYSKTFKKLAE
jgi:antitoxin component of MazEF toxin-antitoxin module